MFLPSRWQGVTGLLCSLYDKFSHWLCQVPSQPEMSAMRALLPCLDDFLQNTRPQQALFGFVLFLCFFSGSITKHRTGCSFHAPLYKTFFVLDSMVKPQERGDEVRKRGQ